MYAACRVLESHGTWTGKMLAEFGASLRRVANADRKLLYIWASATATDYSRVPPVCVYIGRASGESDRHRRYILVLADSLYRKSRQTKVWGRGSSPLYNWDICLMLV